MVKNLLKSKDLSTICHLAVNRTLFWFTATFLFWRLSLFLAYWLGTRFIPLKEGFLGGEGTGVWANFDGVHYLSIAQRGYIDFEQTFFPLYPLLIRLLAPVLGGNLLFSALFISHVCFIIALFLFSKLLDLGSKDKLVINHQPLVILLLFPTSFFFASVYTESLFLMLILGAFLASRKGKWFWAGILGGLASATRLVGIFLLPALLVEFWQQEKVRQRILKRGVNFSLIISHWPLIIIPFGLLSYMFYLQNAFGDPLRFLYAQKAVGYREMGKIILLPQVFWRYLKIFLRVSPKSFAFWVAVLEFGTTLLFLFLTLLSFSKLSLSYGIFMLLSILTPTLTGTLNSLPRYVLTCFPGFILLGMIKNQKAIFILYSIFLILLLLLTAVFTRGYFVS